MEKLKKLRFAHLFVGFATMVLLLELGGLAFEIKYKDRFYPRVVIGGQSVGGKTYQEVVDHFKSDVNTLAKDGLTLTVQAEKGEKKIVVPMSRTGLTSDALVDYFSFGNLQGVIDQAYAWGRTGSFTQKFKERFSLIPTKKFSFPVTVYDEAIELLLKQELAGFLTETVPASFSYKSGNLITAKEQVGEVVDVEIHIKKINEQLASLNHTPVALSVVADTPLSTADRLNRFNNLANELAKSTILMFRYNGYKWKVVGPTLVTWLTMKSDSEIGIDPAKLEDFLTENVVPAIDNPPQNSRFEMRQGQLVEIYPGRAGKIVDVKKTIENVERIVQDVGKSFAAGGNVVAAVAEASGPADAVLVGGVIEVPVVIVDAEPNVTKATIAQYKIKDLVGTARTNFAGGSANRQKNIAVGAGKLNGILIAPGEEFSLVNSIGYVTEEEGYTEEYMIKEGKTVKGLGGGLCQVATTLFRTALNAGLPITERVNHRYIIGYYGPGLDATIYGPHPDLRFVNDTDGYLLLQGRVDGNEVEFEFYGQKDGRVVTVSEPEITDRIDPPLMKLIPTYDLPPNVSKCTEKARQGLTANALYSVAYPNGKIKTQNFKSVYTPWQEVCLVGVAR